MEVQRRPGEDRSADDAVALVLERLVRREREPVGGVVHVAVEDEGRDLRGLALIDDDLVEVHLVGEETARVAHHRELRRGHARRVDLVGTDRVGLVGTEVVHLFDERLAGVGRARPAAGVEVLRLLGQRAEDLVRLDPVPEDEPLPEAGGLAVVEADREVVGRLDLVDEVPDPIGGEPSDPVRGRDVLGRERGAVVPLDAGAQLHLVGVTALGCRLGQPEVPLRVRPAVHRERGDVEVGVDAPAEDRVGREVIPVALRREDVRPAAVELSTLRAAATTCGAARRAWGARRGDEPEAGQHRVAKEATPAD